MCLSLMKIHENSGTNFKFENFVSFEVKTERAPLRIQNSSPCLLHPILSAWQGAGLLPIDGKEILLMAFSIG